MADTMLARWRPTRPVGRRVGRRSSVELDPELGDDLARAALGLARRFAAGATMWCLAPAWPEHARHVAVEFVHPVIVGKRALPAVSVDRPRSGRRAARHGRAPATSCSRSAGRRPPVVADVAAPRRRVGCDVALDRRRAAPAPRRGRPRRSGSTTPTRRRRRARRPPRAALPRAVGADPRVLRAPRPARRAPTTCDATTVVHHLLRRGPAGRGRVASPTTAGDATVRTAEGIETVDTTLVGAGRTPATSCSSTPARPSRLEVGRRWLTATDFLYPFIEARRARRRRAAGRPRRARRGAKAAASAELRDDDARARSAPTLARGRRRRWPSGSRRAGGCSPSATAAARPTRRRSPRCSPARRRGRPLPARCLVDDTAVLTALGNDVGFDLVFSRQLIAHADARRHRRRVVDQRQLAQPARRVRRGRGPRPADRRLRRLRRRRDGAVGRRASTASSSTPTASTASRRPRPRSGFALWAAVQAPDRRRRAARWLSASRTTARPAVLDRIEAFRRRRPAPDRRRRHAGPRRRRQGVGGAGRRGVPRRVRRRRARRRWPTRPTLDAADRRAAGVHHRLVRRAAACASRAARSATSPCTAPSTTSP